MGINFGGDKKGPLGGTVNITSHNQSGGITAHTVNHTVNVQRRPAARHVDDAFRAHLLSVVPTNKPVEVLAVAGDAEAHAFATEIMQALNSAGHCIGGVGQAMFADPLTGHHLFDIGKVTQIQVRSNPG